MNRLDVEAIRAQVRALDFVRRTPAEVAMWREDAAEASANLAIEGMALTEDEASPQGLCARQRFGRHNENTGYATSLRRAMGSLRVRNSPGESWFAHCQR